MCDRCSKIFSILEEDWQQVTVKQVGNRSDRPAVIEVTMHTCANCALTPHRATQTEIEGNSKS